MRRLTILFLLFTSINIFSQDRDYTIDTFNIKSEILQEIRSIIIYKPGTFDCFIASSPTPIMDLIENEYYRRIDSVSNDKIKFCFSFGSKDMNQVRKWSLKLKDNLTGMDFKNLEWRFKIFKGKNHYNSFMVALFWGVNYVK